LTKAIIFDSLKEVSLRKLKYLTLPNGKSPFLDWLKTIDKKPRAVITDHLRRLISGGAKKNIKALGNGVFELKVKIGPGYRLYFGEDGKSIILLLLGGDKSTQKRDISKAKKLWSQYNV